MGKTTGWTWVTADKVVTNKPALLHYASLTGDGNGAADVTIYEGTGTDGRKIKVLRAPQYASHPFAPKGSIPVEKGIYVDVGSNVEGVFIQWDAV